MRRKRRNLQGIVGGMMDGRCAESEGSSETGEKALRKDSHAKPFRSRVGDAVDVHGLDLAQASFGQVGVDLLLELDVWKRNKTKKMSTSSGLDGWKKQRSRTHLVRTPRA